MFGFLRSIGFRLRNAPAAEGDPSFTHVMEMAAVIASIAHIQLGLTGEANTHQWSLATRKTVLGFIGGLAEKFAAELQLDPTILMLAAADTVLEQDAMTSGLVLEYQSLKDSMDLQFVGGREAGFKDYVRFRATQPCIGLIDCLGLA